MKNVVSFMTANYVAQRSGYAMDDWPHGDRTTQEWFAPLETFPERFGVLLSDVRALGFDAIDLWAAHLHHSWATAEHLAAAQELLEQHGLTVTSYAVRVGTDEAESVCDVAAAVGTTLIGGLAPDPRNAAPVLRERGMRLGIENHAERTPQEILEQIGDDADVLGTTIDTGWWFANHSRGAGIDAADTNAVDAKTSGARIGNDAACAASALAADKPTSANTHESECANSNISPIPAIRPNTLVWMRQPTMKPTPTIKETTNTLRTRSASVRPASTAERDIGSDWNRSMRPLWRSSARPTPVWIDPNTTVCANTPGIR